MTNSDYLEKYRTLVEVCDAAGCEIGETVSNMRRILTAAGDDPDTVDQDTKDAAMLLAKEEYLAIAFMLSADRIRFGKMLEDLMNDYLQGDEMAFPINLTDAHRLLEYWCKGTTNAGRRMNLAGGEGIAYTQHSEGPQQNFIAYQGRPPRGRGGQGRGRG